MIQVPDYSKRITLETDCWEASGNVGREVVKDVSGESIFFQTHRGLNLPSLRGKLFASGREGSSLLAVLGSI